MDRWSWLGFGACLLALGGYLVGSLLSDDQRVFLPGPSSHGHYQIESKCEACHTEMMGVKVEACEECHGEELDVADDSHPSAKFLDPRNADYISKINVMHCVTCHVEHRPQLTGPMAVTMPEDYCFRCHFDIAEERPNHKPYGFETCLDGGCHNFHDNRALNVDFLEKHLGEPMLGQNPRRVLVERAQTPGQALGRDEHDAPAQYVTEEAIDKWQASGHAQAGINCSDCHQPQGASAWEEQPKVEMCGECHEPELEGFFAGHHGMRLKVGLSPMTPRMARLPMHDEALERTLDCGSCHEVHRVDTQRAQTEACQGCHADEHTLAYPQSVHASLWARELSGELPKGAGVSCATCHLPAVTKPGGKTATHTQHNQNDNLRPNEKMVRSVCMSCHGVEFAITALADPELINNNFQGRSDKTIESFDLVREKSESAGW